MDENGGQKTIVAWVVGLLIGGMLVWAFSGEPCDQSSYSSSIDSELPTIKSKAIEACIDRDGIPIVEWQAGENTLIDCHGI